MFECGVQSMWICIWWGGSSKPHPWEQEENKPLRMKDFSSTHHHTAAQAEVPKLCTEVQNAQQCCLLPSGTTSEAKAENERT